MAGASIKDAFVTFTRQRILKSFSNYLRTKAIVMFYKLYLQTFKEDKQPDYAIVGDMVKLYHANGVTVLGHFINKKKPNQSVLITVFEDEAHYNRFVATMEQDEGYQQRREYLESIREDITILDLELNKHSLLHPSEMDLSDYIKDVKNMKEVFEPGFVTDN